MCDFGAWEELSNIRRSVSSYLDVDTRKYQYRLLNPTLLEFIAGNIMEDTICDRDFNNLPQQRLNLIDGPISSY